MSLQIKSGVANGPLKTTGLAKFSSDFIGLAVGFSWFFVRLGKFQNTDWCLHVLESECLELIFKTLQSLGLANEETEMSWAGNENRFLTKFHIYYSPPFKLMDKLLEGVAEEEGHGTVWKYFAWGQDIWTICSEIFLSWGFHMAWPSSVDNHFVISALLHLMW